MADTGHRAEHTLPMKSVMPFRKGSVLDALSLTLITLGCPRTSTARSPHDRWEDGSNPDSRGTVNSPALSRKMPDSRPPKVTV